MIRVQKCKQRTKISHIKYSRLLARWQEISDPFKPHSIGLATIQPHHHNKYSEGRFVGFASLDWYAKSNQKKS